MLFMIVSFVIRPRKFIQGWLWSRKNFDKNGYPK